MKLLSIFMALFIIGLSLDICPDEDLCVDNKNVEVRESDQHSSEKEAHCSPFCHCAHCPVSFFIPRHSVPVYKNHVLDVQWPGINAGLTDQITKKVWQPPKRTV